MRMKPLFAALAIAMGMTGALTGGPVLAADQSMLTEAKIAEITALMVAQGYEVRSVQIEDGKYEVYAVKDGAMVELYLDDTLALVAGGDDDED